MAFGLRRPRQFVFAWSKRSDRLRSDPKADRSYIFLKRGVHNTAMADQNVNVDSKVSLTSPVVWIYKGKTQVAQLGRHTLKFVDEKTYVLECDENGYRWVEVLD